MSDETKKPPIDVDPLAWGLVPVYWDGHGEPIFDGYMTCYGRKMIVRRSDLMALHVNINLLLNGAITENEAKANEATMTAVGWQWADMPMFLRPTSNVPPLT